MLKKLLSLSFVTFLIKPLGYLRDVSIANVAGISFYSDLFFFIYSIPTSVRQILYSTSFNAAFVPFYKNIENKEGQTESINFASSFFVTTIYVIFPIILLLEIFMFEIIKLLNFEFITNLEELIFAKNLARVLLAYLFLLFIGAILIGISYSYKKFLLPTLLSSIINISIIVCIFLNIKLNPEIDLNQLFVFICISILVGSILEIFIIYIYISKIVPIKSFIYKFSIFKSLIYFNLIKNFIFKLIPSISFEALHQINRIYSLAFASLIVGGISSFHYANIIVALPLSVFGVTLSIVLIPFLSSKFSKNFSDRIDLIQKGIKYGIFFGLPITFFFYFFSEMIIGSIFFRGAFTQNDIYISSQFLSILSFSIPANLIFRTIIVYYFADSNTKKPFVLYLYAFLLNVFLIYLFKNFFGLVGIAYAYVSSIWFFLLLLLVSLSKIKIKLIDKNIFYFFMKYLFISSVMIISQYFLFDFFSLNSYSFYNLIFLVFFGFLIFFLLVLSFSYNTLRHYLSSFLRA